MKNVKNTPVGNPQKACTNSNQTNEIDFFYCTDLNKFLLMHIELFTSTNSLERDAYSRILSAIQSYTSESQTLKSLFWSQQLSCCCTSSLPTLCYSEILSDTPPFFKYHFPIFSNQAQIHKAERPHSLCLLPPWISSVHCQLTRVCGWKIISWTVPGWHVNHKPRAEVSFLIR